MICDSRIIAPPFAPLRTVRIPFQPGPKIAALQRRNAELVANLTAAKNIGKQLAAENERLTAEIKRLSEALNK